MESELPTLLYLLFFALALIALVPACRLRAVQHPVQIFCTGVSDQTISQTKP